MLQQHIMRRLKTVITDSVRRAWTSRLISTVGLIFVFLFLLTHIIDRRAITDIEVDHPVPQTQLADEGQFEINNYGTNVNLVNPNI